MLNIFLTDCYITAHDLLLVDDAFTEEVAVEASSEPFHLTGSIGYDRKGSYMTWNLRYYNAFIEHKTIRLDSINIDTSNHDYLLRETKFKFRQLLCKAANRSGAIAQIAREQLVTL